MQFCHENLYVGAGILASVGRCWNIYSRVGQAFALERRDSCCYTLAGLSWRLVARMRVPKMVKNGFNSGLPVSPVFEENKIPKEIKNRHEAQSRP
jgi:hypothetical protein